MNPNESSGHMQAPPVYFHENDGSTVAQSQATIASLSIFRVFLGTGGPNNQVFANNQQRIMLRIEVLKEVQPSIGPWVNAPLTDTEIASLTLMGPNNQIPNGWEVHRSRGIFRLAGPIGPASHLANPVDNSSREPTLPLNPIAETFELYLSTSQIHSPINWYAEITLDLPNGSGNRRHTSGASTIEIVGVPPQVIPVEQLERVNRDFWDEKVGSVGTHLWWSALSATLYRFSSNHPPMRGPNGVESRYAPPISIEANGPKSNATREAQMTVIAANQANITDLELRTNNDRFQLSSIRHYFARTENINAREYFLPREYSIRITRYYEQPEKFPRSPNSRVVLTFQDVYGTVHRYIIAALPNGEPTILTG